MVKSAKHRFTVEAKSSFTKPESLTSTGADSHRQAALAARRCCSMLRLAAKSPSRRLPLSSTLGLMYQCSHCNAQLRRWAVLTSGSANPKACPACGGRYFGGGLPGFMVVLCTAFAVATVVGALSTSPGVVYAITYITAFAIGTWHMLRTQPLPLSRRWRQTALTFAPVSVLFLLSQAIGYFR